ncbi:6-mannosyltransferase, partial [Durusdinium trenchii]
MARKDEEVEKFVQQNSDQLLWPIWPGLTHVERADVFRYLVLWKEGGYYADANVECMKPIDEWGIPNEATMIAGYEFGHRLPEEDRKLFQFARTEQFEQWFLASAPGNPVLLRCMELVRQRYSWKLQDTLQLSGAGVWSDAVHEFLARTVPEVLEKEVAFRSNKSELLRKDTRGVPSERLYGPDASGGFMWVAAAGRVNPEAHVEQWDPTDARLGARALCGSAQSGTVWDLM